MNNIISPLNARLPQLPRWRQVLLIIAAVLASIECLALTLDGEKFLHTLMPLSLVLLVWMTPPAKRRDKFVWWSFISCLAYAVGGTDLYFIQSIMH
jgi:hypothetical protein